MPIFVFWDEDQRQLVIQSNDLADAGLYTITVVAKIEIPNDFTRQTFTEKTATTVLSLKVSGVSIECESTIFESFELNNLEGAVHGDIKEV